MDKKKFLPQTFDSWLLWGASIYLIVLTTLTAISACRFDEYMKEYEQSLEEFHQGILEYKAKYCTDSDKEYLEIPIEDFAVV